MLYLATYTVPLDNVETAMAKRLEWETAQPEGFKILCEYVAHGQPPPFGGVMVFETEAIEDLSFLVLFFGSTVRFDIRPCSDVLATIESASKAFDQGE